MDMAEPRTVVCFGDSNTWGYDPGTGERYGRSVRWPGVLRSELGPTWDVVEAGLSGRTTVFEDPLGDMCGARHVGPVIVSAKPVEMVVVVLGTNDLKSRFGVSAFDIAEGAGRVVDLILASACGPGGMPPGVLLVAPPPLVAPTGAAPGDPGARAEHDAMWRDGVAASRAFARLFERAARSRAVAFLDAGAHVRTSDVDGVHWPVDGHRALGVAVASLLR